MTLPVLQIMLGIGIGLLGILWVRKRALTYNQGNNYDYEHVNQYVHRIKNKKTNQLYSQPGDDCSICLEQMTAEEMHFFSCNHAVHNNCFERSITYGGNSCPVCRHRF